MEEIRMNKQECKKYLRKAFKRLKMQKKSINPQNIAYELVDVSENQMMIYIAYSKIALNNMINSGNIEICINDLLAQIDILPEIYPIGKAIEVANKL